LLATKTKYPAEACDDHMPPTNHHS
jgi:hypothetical protein